MSHNEWDDCFLLHQRSYGETSVIAEIFSKKNGKMSIIARGAKKPKSKFFGYLAPFTKLKVTYSGRSDLKTLTNIDRDFSSTTNSLSKTSYSLLYINELLIRLLPKDAAQEDLFLLYQEFLIKVHAGDDLELTLRHFELDLLDMLGYGLDFETDIDKNEDIEATKKYSFIPERGFRESSESEFTGEDIINIRSRDLSKVSKKYLKHLTQTAIHFCLDGRDLASRDIFKRIQS
ncbi:DNA repair protein RecO [Gammaproteobacteria bacterium]|jgi:DNA repair protein RecO (recombination protein O)|nr:DNA repair protein RecO [Gammaproteobacteria bacterium]|tara:strand:+ start:1143 stop:1838 length:696 start_codon:yes stop_codon:yes gene_type:complete